MSIRRTGVLPSLCYLPVDIDCERLTRILAAIPDDARNGIELGFAKGAQYSLPRTHHSHLGARTRGISYPWDAAPSVDR